MVFGPMHNAWIQCPTCKGKKTDPKKRTRLCPQCSGQGRVPWCDRCRKPYDSCPCDEGILM